MRARSRAGSRDTAASTTAATATAGAGTLLNGRTENRYRNAVLWKKQTFILKASLKLPIIILFVNI